MPDTPPGTPGAGTSREPVLAAANEEAAAETEAADDTGARSPAGPPGS